MGFGLRGIATIDHTEHLGLHQSGFSKTLLAELVDKLSGIGLANLTSQYNAIGGGGMDFFFSVGAVTFLNSANCGAHILGLNRVHGDNGILGRRRRTVSVDGEESTLLNLTGGVTIRNG